MNNNKKAPLRRYTMRLGSIGILVLFLLASATPAQALLGNGCSAEDQTNGHSGQSVSCAFTCPSGSGSSAGTVTVSVEADDRDAGVSGTGSCPGGSAHCSGQQICEDTSDYNGGGAGSCSADSDELNDSGLYVSCGARSATGGGPNDPLLCPPLCDGLPPAPTPDLYDVPGLPDEDVIPHHGMDPNTEFRLGKVQKPGKVNPSENAAFVPVDIWNRALEVLPDLPALASSFDSYVFMHFDGETAIGITCQAGICQDFTPTLQNDANGFRLAA